MNLSFAGCGFLGIYHVGVVSCFKEYVPHLVQHISGASAGALAACSLLCDLPLGRITSDTLKVSVTARTYRLGPFSPKFDVNQILEERLRDILPPDAFLRCRGRLHISCTRVSDGKNVILNEFNSNEELIQALLCSSFIPIFSGIVPPTYRGVRYIDGCYSDNLPILNENTITVSPFCGECDICPRDNSYNLMLMNLANTSIELSTQNLYRFMRVLFPPHPEILSQLCKQGFYDAMRYLKTKDLISCARCLSVNSTIELSRPRPEAGDASDVGEQTRLQVESEDNCSDCKQRKQVVHLDNLPEEILSVLQEACTSMNQGFINWVFQHKSMKVLSVLTLPYVLPLDFAYVVFIKFLEIAPKISQDLNRLLNSLIDYVKNVMKKFNKSRHYYSAKFTCQLALTEYDYETVDGGAATQPSPTDVSLPVVDARRPSSCTDRLMGRVNFDITVDLQTNSTGGSSSSNHPLSSALSADSEERKAVMVTNAARVWDQQKIDSRSESSHVDLVEVMRTHDALMSYYYLDENNHMKVTDIYNVGNDASLAAMTADGQPRFPYV